MVKTTSNWAIRIACLMFIGFTFMGMISKEADWELAKEKNGIKVFTRKVEGSNFKEYKAMTTIETSMDEAMALFKDFAGYKNWVPDCIEAKQVKKESNDLYYYYIQIKAPWPVSNRDAGVKFQVVENSDGSITCKLSGAPDIVDKRKGVVRMTYKGYWKIIPQEGGKVKFINQVHADPNGSIPAWLANSAVVDSPFETFANMKKLLK